MAEPEEKTCPRCRNVFNCKKDDIAHCGCRDVVLSNATRDFLTKTHYHCLCNDCLRTINEMVEKTKDLEFPYSQELMVEGLHYYKEGDSRVFTEFYHLLRGHCCRNGCRHCAYGYKKKYWDG